MDMEGVRSSFVAALLFLTLLVLAATRSSGDDAARAAEEPCRPLADKPAYKLVTFKNHDGEEIRLLSDQRSGSVSAFANRSGNWFYITRAGEGKRRRRRRLLSVPQPSDSNRSRGSRMVGGLWNTLGVLVNATGAASDPAADDDGDERYVLVGLQTSGGDKIRLVAIADRRYVAITGFAKGFFYSPRWFFRDGDRYRLVVPALGNGSSHGSGSSPAEVVASSLLAAMMKEGSSCVY